MRHSDLGRPLSLLLLALLSTISAGCAGSALDDAGPELVFERTTEDGATVVRNVSGSVWPGPARLVEEAVIGSTETEEEAYMLGWVPSLWSTEEAIYLLDPMGPVIRAYDADGTYTHDIGRAGEGPGEYGGPNGVVVDPRGRVLVAEARRHLILVYTADGTHEETWSWAHSGNSFGARRLLAAPDGTVWAATFEVPEGGDFDQMRDGYVRVGPNGAGETVLYPDPPGFEPVEVVVPTPRGQETYDWVVPFAPRAIQAMDGEGNAYVGTGAEYRFWIFGADGSRTIVERYHDPVPVQADEASAHLRQAEALVRRMARVPEWKWTGPDVPGTKPAFDDIVPDYSGRIWVERPGPGRRIEGCEPPSGEAAEEESCWSQDRFWDVFEGDGRYLGEVPVPASVNRLMFAHIQDDRVLMAREDDFGNTQVVRYRLEVPGAEDLVTDDASADR